MAPYRVEGHAAWFTGEWGFRHYIEREGFAPLTSRDARVAEGDVVVVAGPTRAAERFAARPRERIVVLERKVAVQRLRGELGGSDLIERMRSERQILARLEHPNIATLYDGGTTEDSRPFLVMEYVEGGSVHDRLRRGPVRREQALEWLEQTARALDQAHANGVVHGDVKPANLLLDADVALTLKRRVDGFYLRLAHRRFNSLETYNDRIMREHFRSGTLFLDYYADLAQAFADANFEKRRPQRIEVEEFLSWLVTERGRAANTIQPCSPWSGG